MTLRIGYTHGEIMNPRCLRQFSVCEKQIMEALIGVWKVRAEQPLAQPESSLMSGQGTPPTAPWLPTNDLVS